MMGYLNSTPSPWNRTDEDIDHPAAQIQAMRIISALGAVISLLGLGGNGLVLYFLLCSVRWDHFSVFLFHLALANSIHLACLLMRYTGQIVTHFHGIPFPLPYLDLFLLTSYLAGLCLVVAIGVSRCLSVFFPMWHRLHSPKYWSTIVCILSWVWAISLSVLDAVFCDNASTYNKFCAPFVTGVCVFLFILLCATLLCFVVMLFKIKCSSQVRPPRKLYIILALTAMSILCLALPVLDPLLPVNPYDDELVSLFSCVNSSANPLVYYFAGRMGKQRRQPHLREVFQTAVGEELGPSPGASGHSTCGSGGSVEVTHRVRQGS